MNCGFVLFFAFLSVALAELPNGWKACKRSSKDYDACFIREITNAVNTILDGDKKLGSLPIDPLRIDKLKIPKHNSPVSVDLSFSDLDVEGLKKFKILNAKNDWKTAKGVIHVPDIVATGNYKVDGKVLVLPIVGQGKCNLTLHDTNFNVEVVWKQIDKGGKKYFQMQKFDTNITPKRLYIHLDNLFNGNKALGDNMNVFLDENWDKILDELRPAVNSALSQALTSISNRVLSQIPAKDIDLP